MNRLEEIFVAISRKARLLQGIRYALNQAIANMAESEPLAFEDCIGKPGFGNDPTITVLRLVHQYFAGEAADDEEGQEDNDHDHIRATAFTETPRHLIWKGPNQHFQEKNISDFTI